MAALQIDDGATIRDAMVALNSNGREVVLLRDSEGRIRGLITDGDIRRGLLSGRALDAPATEVMRRDFFSVSQQMDRSAVLDLMKARSFRHVPVLDEFGRLSAMHFLRDLIGAETKPNIAVIMAGGQGTRLRPFTETIPKPMVEVAGRPILERIILHLVGHGVRRIFLAVNYRSEVIEGHFGDGAAFGCQIDYLRETRPLGTGGPLSLLPEREAHPILVLNGDQITQADLSAMLEVHERGRYAATICVGPHQVQVPFATVVERGGRVLNLEEKPTMNLLVNRGIYVLDPLVVEGVPKDTEFPITTLFDRLLELKQEIGVYYSEDYWLDVGRPADLFRANGLT